MRRTLIRYRVKPGRAAENRALIENVFAALHRAQPANFQYESFQLPDGVSFVHLVSSADESPLRSMPAFAAFIAAIAERCDEAPASFVLEEIGAYRSR